MLQLRSHIVMWEKYMSRLDHVGSQYVERKLEHSPNVELYQCVKLKLTNFFKENYA